MDQTGPQRGLVGDARELEDVARDRCVSVSDTDAREMRKLYNLLTWLGSSEAKRTVRSTPEFDRAQQAFLRAYRDAFTRWQELGGEELWPPRIAR